jgi:hypothetical protein
MATSIFAVAKAQHPVLRLRLHWFIHVRWTRCKQPLREPFVSSSTSTAPTPANRTQIPTLDREKEEADSLGRTQVTKHDPIQHHHAGPVKSPALRDGGLRGRYRMRLAGAATMQVTSSFLPAREIHSLPDLLMYLHVPQYTCCHRIQHNTVRYHILP